MKWGGISHGLDGKTLLTKTTNLAYKVGESCDSISTKSYKQLLLLLKESFEDIFKSFAIGDFDTTKSQLTTEKYLSLSKDLYNARNITNNTYEEIRQVISLTLQNTYQGISQQIQLTDTLIQLEHFIEKASILNDMDKLREYLSDLNKHLQFLPPQEVTLTVAPEMKEPYKTYVCVFKFPTNGIWNPELLAYINLLIETKGQEDALAYLIINEELLKQQYNL